MTTFRTSAPVERAFMTRKSWQNAGRREFIHNKVQGLSDIRRPSFINRLALVLKGARRQQCRLGK